ncbi:MAG: diguanylate cyclase [Clostridia bacterium]|nr:diguanylate cyclase [Clostridia bacterium]
MSYKDKHLIKIIALLILSVFLMVGCIQKPATRKASQGLLDLTTWDVERDGMVSLDGEWALYPNRFLTPEECKDETYTSEAQYIEVPNSYKTTVSGRQLPMYGYGTMRLVIQMPEDAQGQYGLIVRQILNASKVWINGDLVSEIGRVGTESINSEGSFERQLIAFFSDADQVDIVVQMSNFDNVVGRIRPIPFGNYQTLKRHYTATMASDIFISGALFIMAIYHFALYYKRPSNKMPLYFAFFSMIIALRDVLVGGRLIYELVPTIDFGLFNKLAYLTVYAAFPFIVMFFKELFPDALLSRFTKGIMGISIVISLITLFSEISVYDRFLKYVEALILVFFAYLLMLVVRAVFQQVDGAGIVLFGTGVFLLAATNDMLVQSGLLHTRSLASYGFFVFIFSQSYLLAAQFSDAYLKIEKLVQENKKLYIDTLTGILNRRGFYDKGEALLEHVETTGEIFTVFYGDLNGLKSINDNFGHRAGDEAIKAAAEIMKKSF